VLAFWALGGGQGTEKQQPAVASRGFNTRLPKASLQQEKMDKMSLYNLAEKDAKALKEARMQDPYADDRDTLVKGQKTDNGLSKDNFYAPSYSYQSSNIHDYQDSNQIRVQKKLDELEKALNAGNSRTEVFSGQEASQTNHYDAEAAHNTQLGQMMSG